MRSSLRTLFVLLLFVAANLGCAMSAGQSKGTPTPNIGTLAAQTVAAIVTNTPAPRLAASQTPPLQASPTPWPTATAAGSGAAGTPAASTTAAPQAEHTPSEAEQTATMAAYTPIETTTNAQNVNMRQGPGTLFPVQDRLAEGTTLGILSKARGDDWVFVDTGTQQGWVSVDFTTLQSRNTLAGVPIREVRAAVVVHGKVVDAQGKGVDGAVFAVEKDNGSSNPPRTDGHSMTDGNFYAYLPGSTSGSWRVSWVAFDCKSSLADGNCKVAGAIDPKSIQVALPTKEIFTFQYTK